MNKDTSKTFETKKDARKFMRIHTNTRAHEIWDEYNSIPAEIEHIDNIILKEAVNSTKETTQIFDSITNLMQKKQDLLKKYTKYTENLKNLNEKQRNIINLYFIKQQPTSYICKQLNMSLRTFYRHIEEIKEKISL